MPWEKNTFNVFYNGCYILFSEYSLVFRAFFFVTVLSPLIIHGLVKVFKPLYFKHVSMYDFVVILNACSVAHTAVLINLHYTSGAPGIMATSQKVKTIYFCCSPVVLVFNIRTLKPQLEPICYLFPRHKLFSLSAE